MSTHTDNLLPHLPPASFRLPSGIGPKLEPDYRDKLDQHISTLRTLIESAETDWQSVNPDEFHHAKESLDQASIRMHEISIAESLREDAARW